MPDGGDSATIKIYGKIADVDASGWDACARIGADDDNPFVSHAFLNALEESRSATERAGWMPQHIVAEDGAGIPMACAPMYVKSHSQGEYVFDHAWADAYERAGGRYYPKLQVAVPFTPVTGPRLLVRPGAEAAPTRQVLVAALLELARQRTVSSLHITFCTQAEQELLGEQGFLRRLGKQFHWHNRGYETFDDFLAALNSRKRKSIRKERQAANAHVDFEVLSGDTLEAAHMAAFHRFYLSTVDRKWAHAYLNRRFFTLLRERLADKIVLVMARHDGEYVGGALNLRGSDTLFGRNWGCGVRFRMLYFEACFYRAIEYAIEHGLARVEAGAQGPHKISRGYLPSETYSAHWIRDPSFRDAVGQYLIREDRQTRHEMEMLEDERSPYRKDNELQT